jgi:hypothetical protein
VVPAPLYPLTSPVRARLPLAGPGGTDASYALPPVSNPPVPPRQSLNQPAGTRLIPARSGWADASPVLAAPPQTIAGIATIFGTGALTAGGTVPAPFRQATAPVRAPVPQTFSKGRATGSRGAPVRNPSAGPVFRQATSPAQTRIPQNWSKGRAYGNIGAPVQNPHPAQLQPLQKALHAQPAVFSKGRITSTPAGLLRNPTSGAPFPPLTQPVHRRYTLPPAGRASGRLGLPIVFVVPVFTPGMVAISPAGPLAATATITPGPPAALVLPGFVPGAAVPGIAPPGSSGPSVVTPPSGMGAEVTVAPAAAVTVTVTPS